MIAQNNMFTIEEAKQKLAGKEISSEELVNDCISKIESGDGEIHAFLEVFKKDAIAAARTIDKQRVAGEELPELAGIPVALKDNMLVQGHVASGGSQILEHHVASYDATVTRKLKNAGAIILGRLNMDDAAMGSSTETSHYGQTRNPWNLSKVPGGSSGGPAAAVAAGFVPASFGSDTGGSIRQPAALCGVVGLKPTYGRVSRHGLIALSSSLDVIGPMTQTVADAATLLRVVEGADPKDSTSQNPSETSVAELLKLTDIRGLKIGIPKEYFISGMDPEVEARVREVITLLESHGASVEEITLPHTPYALETYYIIQPAEASSNLARYDGMRYSMRATGERLEDVYLKTRGEGFGREVKRRIMLGTFVLSAGYADAYYKKALAIRQLLRQDVDAALSRVDVILTPTSPSVAWPLGEKFNDPIAMYLADIFTVTANLTGHPALSVPCGFAHDLPVGVQFIGRHFDEDTLFRVGHFYQSITDWHKNSPL